MWIGLAVGDVRSPGMWDGDDGFRLLVDLDKSSLWMCRESHACKLWTY